MELALIIVFALVGTAIGSFLNVCIDRLPAGKSIVSPPSHCEVCQRRLVPVDLVPVFSYLWLRRRCRYCKAPIPLRPLWVEAGTGCLFAYFFWHFGLSVELAVAVFYGSLFIVIGIIDLEHGLILDKIIFPALPVALIIDSFVAPAGSIAFYLPWPWLNGLANGLVGGAIGFVFLLIVYLASILIYKREGMGLGDVKMAILIGLVTGPLLVLVTLAMGALLGALAGIFLLVLKIKKRKESIPFGPFLSLATIVTLLWGSTILSYIGIF